MNFEIDSDCSVGMEFYDFNVESEQCSIRIDGCCGSDDEWCTSYISGLHRWKPDYKKKTYAKLQCLNDWYDEHHSPITLVTFTTRQRDLEKWEQIDLLKSSFNKGKKMLNKRLGRFPYVWVMECHESGYSHIHMIIFREVPRKVRRELQGLWNNKYCAGGYGEALNFSIKKGQRDLRSAGAYVFAYVVKTLDYEMLKHVDSGYYIQSSWVWKMSRHDTDYTGVRLWGCSRDISEAMAYSGEKNLDAIWWRVSWKIPDGGWFP
ncbi:MAG TPA: hypothetical protein V6C97_05565, partial [Oculatellaceae cyanobacterium]